MDSHERATQQVHDTLTACFEQIRFARAAELARSGRYLEAEGLLSPNGRESSDPKELDLLARISAQQRRYGRARRLWESALQRSPGNAAYERAIECTRDAERFQALLRKAALIALLSLAVTALAFAVWSYFHQLSPAASEGIRPAPTTPQPAPATPQPAPTTPQPAPATPQPAPTTPQPAPATPQPVPTTPQPASTTPQPAPDATPAQPVTPPQPTKQPAPPPAELENP